MHANHSAPDGAITNIQLAPLIDIALVLVIIFMVTAPLLEQQTPAVNLPHATTVEAAPQASITLTVTSSGALALNEAAMPASELERELRQLVRQHPERVVMIRADKQATHRQTLEALALAKRAGAKKLAIATLQRTPSARTL